MAWEDFISLNNEHDGAFANLDAPSAYMDKNLIEKYELNVDDVLRALRTDNSPLPNTEDREGYYGKRHFEYWLSGQRDMQSLLDVAGTFVGSVKAYLDIGCASGRVIRHFANRSEKTATYGCDLNRRHVDWCNEFLPKNAVCFQTHSIPSIPLPESSIDLISAFSVFTHIEAFETSWLMEIRRILRPGGIAWVTIHSDHTFDNLKPEWPVYNAVTMHPKFKALEAGRTMTTARTVFRWNQDKSYSSNVFYSQAYIRQVWGRFFEIEAIKNEYQGYQDVVVLRKT